MRVALSIPALVLGAGLALAHSGASGVVKERMDAMKAMGDSLKAVKAMVDGAAAYDAAKVAATAKAIAAEAVAMPDHFPHGTDHAPSEALPAVWTEHEAFRSAAGDLGAAAEILLAASDDPSAARDALGDVARACKACHDDFRQDK